jgi:hypothetical protein
LFAGRAGSWIRPQPLQRYLVDLVELMELVPGKMEPGHQPKERRPVKERELLPAVSAAARGEAMRSMAGIIGPAPAVIRRTEVMDAITGISEASEEPAGNPTGRE